MPEAATPVPDPGDPLDAVFGELLLLFVPVGELLLFDVPVGELLLLDVPVGELLFPLLVGELFPVPVDSALVVPVEAALVVVLEPVKFGTSPTSTPTSVSQTVRYSVPPPQV